MVHSCSIRVCECASLEKLQGRNSGPNIFYQIISVYVNSFASLCVVPCCDVLCFYEQQYDALRVCICHNFGITVVCCICSSWLVPTIYMCCIVNVYSKWLQFHIHTLGLFCLVGFELEVVMIYFLLILREEYTILNTSTEAVSQILCFVANYNVIFSNTANFHIQLCLRIFVKDEEIK